MIAEVWCVNDASNAVGVVNGESYCATCIVYAEAEAAKANSCDCGKGEWCPQYGAAFLAARAAAEHNHHFLVPASPDDCPGCAEAEGQQP